MKTRNQRKRRGGNEFTQRMRKAGIDLFGSPTSLLAREIYGMLDHNGIKSSRIDDFNVLMSHHTHANKIKILRDLKELGITLKQEFDVVTKLNIVIPTSTSQVLRNRFGIKIGPSTSSAAKEIFPLLDYKGVRENEIGHMFSILSKYRGVNMENVYRDLKAMGANVSQLSHIRSLYE
jgi:hypothetical protein